MLPRLADEGWLEPASGEWAAIRATGPWWADAIQDREATRAQLLALARSGLGEHVAPPVVAKPVPGGSVLEGLHLAKSFKRRRVVDDVTVDVEQGEIVGLLGPNGAGKTTTFYLITGLIRPDAGRVSLDGKDLTEAPMYKRARAGIGYLAQEPSVFRRMTVEENIIAILETMKLTKRAAVAAGWKRCWTSCRSSTCGRARPTRSPAASAAGWRSPARW